MRFILLVLTVFILAGPIEAQKPGDDDPDEITSSDFERTRDMGSGISGGHEVFRFRIKKKVTREKQLASRPRPPQTGKSKPELPADPASPPAWEKIGVTLWRLTTETKPAEKETARLLTQESDGEKEYTPKRVAADTGFASGDKVRLSIESPRTGYLYVIDREILAGDKLGEPYQIFPTRLSRGGDNRVERGQMIDIPAQSDRASYFTLKSPDPNWRGEMLTIIVSPTPLSAMPVLDKPAPISASMVDTMEDKYLRDTTEYEQLGTAGKSYTKAEKAAGSDGTRQLTQTDPFPQTIYRVKARWSDPMLINVNLSVRR